MPLIFLLKVKASKNVSGLVLLLNGFQVVRMVKLLRLVGCVDYIKMRVKIKNGWFLMKLLEVS